ncbi:MAG: transglutaminase-like domain-containing protein [Lachnospiraceae bacterium]|nr:transglutaminase-like domain-containing protein [Lachnospiraceae bacterium]
MRKSIIQKTALIAAVGMLLMGMPEAYVSGCRVTLASEINSNDENTDEFSCDDMVIENGRYDVCHLRHEATCSISMWKNDSIDFEGYAGFKVKTNGTGLTCSMYSHSPTYDSGMKSVYFDRDDNDMKYELGELHPGETKNFDFADIVAKGNNAEGLWHLNGVFENDYRVSMNLWFDGNELFCCRLAEDAGDSIAAWNSIIGRLNPEKCLSFYINDDKDYPITYPTSGYDGSAVQVDEWRELADEIILFDSWSDEAKVFALVEWLVKNTAYDDWRVKVNNNHSRANDDDAWDQDSYFMFYNHVGQCWDYANAFTIMCREAGIPCTSVDNPWHTANAVWLNGEWVCIDVSSLAVYRCCFKDTDRSRWIINVEHSFGDRYGYYSTMFSTVNQGLCTPTTATDLDAKNPEY